MDCSNLPLPLYPSLSCFVGGRNHQPKSSSWLLEANGYCTLRGCCISLLREVKVGLAAANSLYISTPPSPSQALADYRGCSSCNKYIGNKLLFFPVPHIQKCGRYCQWDLCTVRVNLEWVKLCGAWEGKTWSIHPQTGGVNQQTIKCSTNSLIMGGGPRAEEISLIALQHCLSFYNKQSISDHTHTPCPAHSGLWSSIFSILKIWDWLYCLHPLGKIGIWNQTVWLLHFCWAVWQWKKPFTSLSPSVLNCKMDVSMIISTQQHG